jgi:hypothetical protein
MKYLGLILITVFAISSCNIIDSKRIKGNGKLTSKTYDLKNFSNLDLGSSMEVYITQSNDYSVKIETDENLFTYLYVRVNDGKTLEVDVKDNVNLDASGEVKVYISVPALDKVNLSGAAQLQTEGKFVQDKKIEFDLSGASSGNISVRAPLVELEASGASTLTVDGESRDVKTSASGASTINSYDLKSENADVEASGASTVHVFSSLKLNARSHGASSVKYRGNPQVTSDVSGASSVGKD